MQNGKQAATKLGHGANSGLPWITILDSAGDEIINSDGPQGNIGCPITEKECGYFMTMIEQSKQRLTKQQTTDLATALDAYVAPKRRGNN
jgi:hypothetical protein